MEEHKRGSVETSLTIVIEEDGETDMCISCVCAVFVLLL